MRMPLVRRATTAGAASRAERTTPSVGWGLPLLVGLMDTAWITPYALLLGTIWRPAGWSLLAPIAILVLLTGAQVGTRRLLVTTKSRYLPLLLIAVGVIVTVLSVAWQYGSPSAWRWQAGPAVAAWLFAMLVWRRGLVIGRTELEYYDVEAVFNLGLGAFGVYAAIMAAGKSVDVLATTATAAFPYLLVFFAASLVALPLARLQSVQRQTRAAVRMTTVSRGWYVLIVTSVLILIGLATLAGAVLRLDVTGIVHAFGSVLDVLLVVLIYGIALPIGFVLSRIIWVIRLMLHPRSPQPLAPMSPPAWMTQLSRRETSGLPPEAAMVLRWSIALILLLVGLLWLARSVFRYEWTGRRVPADIVRDSVWSWSDLRTAWRALFRKRSGTSAAAPLVYGTGAAGTIRRIYAEFLSLAAAHGTPRRQHQTPVEFAQGLETVYPSAAAAADLLTAIYGRVRYGVETPSADDLEAAREALARVRVGMVVDLDGAFRPNGAHPR